MEITPAPGYSLQENANKQGPIRVGGEGQIAEVEETYCKTTASKIKVPIKR